MSQAVGCPVLVARWRAEYPDSDEWVPISKKGAERGVYIDLGPGTVDGLTQMFRGEPAGGPSGQGIANARRTSTLYGRYYHLGMPFDRAVVSKAWNRCARGASVMACEEAKSATLARLERPGANP